MTDKQTAIEALDTLAQCECVLAVQGYTDCVEIIRAEIQSKPVDVDVIIMETLLKFKDDIPLDQRLCNPEGAAPTKKGRKVGVLICKIIDHLHAKGYLNTPQTEDTE